MRNMAFSKTVSQMRDGSKTVTRRVGTWQDLEPGTLLMAVEKSQGLGKGETVKRIGVIRVLSVREEPASAVTAHDIVREGFPNMRRIDFLLLLGVVSPATIVTRIEFEHVKEDNE